MMITPEVEELFQEPTDEDRVLVSEWFLPRVRRELLETRIRRRGEEEMS